MAKALDDIRITDMTQLFRKLGTTGGCLASRRMRSVKYKLKV